MIPGRLFLVLQILFFAFVVIGILVYRKRSKERENASQINPEYLGKYFGKGFPYGKKISREGFSSAGTSSARDKPKIFLTTTFPSWNEHTSPYEVLGIVPGADHEVIEKAFKEKLKKYHPDKYAKDDLEYQRRAHEIVLLIQKAKEKLTKT